MSWACGFCNQASEFYSKLARQAVEVFGGIQVTKAGHVTNKLVLLDTSSNTFLRCYSK